MKLAPKPLSDSVYKTLLRKIMDGSLPAGSKLREERLCETLGVSRTPLREGLLRLVKEGIVERTPNCGCVVRERSQAEMAELMDCRSMFEGLALKKAFNALDKGKFRELKEKLLSATSSRKEILEADEAMHKLILDACENRFLKEQIERLQALCAPYRVFRCEDAKDKTAITDERLQIIEAIISGDAEKALAGLEAHFAKSAAAFRNPQKA